MTRIRCCDYSKLTRNIKRIPTCLRHVCCSDPGGSLRQRKQPGCFQASNNNEQVTGSSRGEQLDPVSLRFFGTARKYGESSQRSSGSSFLSLSVFDGMASDQQREIPEC